MSVKGQIYKGMEEKTRKSDKVSLIVMIVLIILLLPILAVNLTLIVKGSLDPDTPPDVFGIAPLAVTSGSMDGDREGSFAKGALIFVKLLDEEEISSLKEGDVITFRSSGAFVTHRIVSAFYGEDGSVVSFVTQGDANDVTDGAIPVGNVVGKCVGSIGGLGDFAMFMQTPVGILVFVGIPVLLYIAYDVTRVVLYNRRADKSRELQEKDEEIRRLRALVEKQGETDAPQESEGSPSCSLSDEVAVPAEKTEKEKRE